MYVTIQNELQSWCAGNKTSCRTEETIDIAKRFPERNNAPRRTTNWNNGVAKGGYNKNYEPRTHSKKTDESQWKPKRLAKYLKCVGSRHTPNYVKKIPKSGNICRTEISYTWFFHVRPPLCIFRKIQEKTTTTWIPFWIFFSKLLGSNPKQSASQSAKLNARMKSNNMWNWPNQSKQIVMQHEIVN